MKRLAWLLLALSLPAWAAINGVDSSRVVLPSFDGTRYGAYVAGDAVGEESGIVYSNDFDGNLENTADDAREGTDGTYYNIGIMANQGDIWHHPDSASWRGVDCGSGRVWDGNLANGTALPDYAIVADPDDGENDVLRSYMDTSAKGVNIECAASARHRAKMEWGKNVYNDPNGDKGFRIVPDVEIWTAWRFRLNCEGDIWNGGSGPSLFFLNESIANVTGEPAVYGKTDCEHIMIAPERYKTSTVYGGGSTVQTLPTSTGQLREVGPFAENEWHCFVSRQIKKPYSVGSATAYIPGTVGGPRAGIFEIYIDGVLQEGSATFQYPAWTGTDHAGRTKVVNGETVAEFNAVYRTGIYWGAQNGAAGSSVTLWQDNIRITTGANRETTVNPPGCPAIQVCRAGSEGNCVPDWKI